MWSGEWTRTPAVAPIGRLARLLMAGPRFGKRAFRFAADIAGMKGLQR